MNKEHQLVKNTMILTIGTICTKILAFVFIPLFSRWLSVEDYGNFDLLGTYITLLIPILTLSCGEAAFRFLIDTDNITERKSIVSTSATIAIVGACIGAVLVALFAPLDNAVKYPFILYMVFEVLFNYLQAYIRGVKKLKIYAASSVVLMILTAVFVTIFVYVMKMKLQGILLGYGVSYFFACIFLIVAGKVLDCFSITASNKAEASRLLHYSTPLIPNTLCWWIMNVSDRTIVKVILGESLLGIYSLAGRIPSLCTTLFGVFQFSWQQSVSETINDHDKEVFYNNVFNNLIKVLSSICIGVLSINFLIFDYIFDPKYAAGYYHLGILIPATALSSVAAYLGGIFIGQKDTKKNGGTTIITAVINVASHLLLVRFIGIYAASVSTLIAYVSLVIIRMVMIRKTIDLRIKKETILISLVFIYYCIIQYFRIPVLEWINIAVACVLFVIINKDFLLSFINKAKRKAG